MLLAGVDAVPGEHRLDRLRVPLGNPVALGVLVHHIQVVFLIAAAQQNNRAMSVAVVHGGKPFDGVGLSEAIADDVNLGAKVFEILAGGKIPAAEVPGVE